MVNLIAFLNSFLSYAMLFVIMVILVIIASIIGVRLRKRKNMQALTEAVEEDKETTK